MSEIKVKVDFTELGARLVHRWRKELKSEIIGPDKNDRYGFQLVHKDAGQILVLWNKARTRKEARECLELYLSFARSLEIDEPYNRESGWPTNGDTIIPFQE